jgi:hypothetical protein
MKITRFRTNSFFVSSITFLTVSLLWGTALSLKATADESCNELLSDLSQYLQFPNNKVMMLHMTNYQTARQWWGGYTQTRLRRKANGHLIGNGKRVILEDQPRASNVEPISYDIDPQSGVITFQGQYTHDMTCIGNKFAIVGIEGGDAVETFTFTKTN